MAGGLGAGARDSKNDEFQAGDPPETAPVACGDAIAYSYRGGPDQEIMRPDVRSLCSEACPERSVYPRRDEVEGENGEHGQEPLDERFSALPLNGGCRAMDAVQELGSSDRGDADWVLRICGHRFVEIQGPSLGGNQDR